MPSLTLFWLAFTGLAASASVTDYAPSRVSCPADSSSLVRVFSPGNQTLHPSETEYVSNRESTVINAAWKDWLGNGSSIGYNVSALDDAFPRLGLALSGGGYRASQFGAGVLNAFDSRNVSAKAAGTGGLLQTATYLSALSGGSWLASSLYSDSFPTIQDMVFGNRQGLSGWLLDLNLALPGGTNLTALENLVYFGSINKSVAAKANEGFNISLVDVWARMLSYHFLNGTSRANFFSDSSAHGAGQLWSDISRTTVFSQHQVPFPFIVVDTDDPFSATTGAIPEDAVVYEFSPFEFASFDPALSAAANLSFVGTAFSEGLPINSASCVTGYDQIGAVMGASSDVFAAFLQASGSSLELLEALEAIFSSLLGNLTTKELVSSRWPNPFRDVAVSTFTESTDSELTLIDGGSNGEVVPLNPLFVKAREVDVIVAVDSSADSDNNWPEGSSLLVTANRISNLLNSTHQPFPPIPQSIDDFVGFGLNLRPTFFGCDPADTPAEYPLVIYIPNSPPLTGASPSTNTNTTSIQYSLLQTQVFLEQSFSNTIGGFVPFSNSPDPQFGRCLQCAAIDRARLNVSPTVARSDFCTTCFQQYCFDPSNPPSNSSLPDRQLIYVNPDPSSPPN